MNILERKPSFRRQLRKPEAGAVPVAIVQGRRAVDPPLSEDMLGLEKALCSAVANFNLERVHFALKIHEQSEAAGPGRRLLEQALLEQARPGQSALDSQAAFIHVEHYSICVAGPDVQSCDLTPYRGLSGNEWELLRASSPDPVLGQLLLEDPTVEVAGSRIICATQAARNVIPEGRFRIAVLGWAGDQALFRFMSVKGGSALILTLPAGLSKGPHSFLALKVRRRQAVALGLAA